MLVQKEIPLAGQWAKYFYDREFKIVPVHGVKADGACDCGRLDCDSVGKHPMVSGWSGKGYFTTSESVVAHWVNYPMSNYGIVTDDLVVIDVDGDEGEQSFQLHLEPFLKDIRTLKIKTGRGYHYFFKVIGDRLGSKNGIFNKVDIKAKGGLIIGVGSLHRSLKRYEAVDYGSDEGGIYIAPLPLAAYDFIKSKLKKNNEPNLDIRSHLAFGGPILEGSRNDTLASHLGRLSRKGLSIQELQALALDFNEKRFQPPLDRGEVLQVVDSIYSYVERDADGILPLFREIEDSQPYPLSDLGIVLSPVAAELSKKVQAPEAFIGQSLLAAASLLVQGYADIEIDGRYYPISLFFLTVGSSGERKSSVDQQILRPFREYEKRAIEKNQVSKTAHNDHLEVYQSEKKAILASKLTPSEKQKAIEDLGGEPRPPSMEVLLVEDPTYEGLVKLLEVGQPSVGLFSDEAGRMIGGYSMNKDNLVKTLAGLSGLWDGNPISRTRVGDGSTKLYGRRLTLHLMMQPKVSQLLLGNDLAVDQGFLSRCLMSYPASKIGTRFYQEQASQAGEVLEAFHRKAHEYLSRPYSLDEKGGLQLKTISLTGEAKQIWITFYNEVEGQLSEGGIYYNISGFASKAPEHALRIAGVLTLLISLEASVIEVKEVSCAISLVRYYLSEALRLHGTSILNPDLILAEKLKNWCQGFEEVYMSQIIQKGPSQVRDKTTAARIISILESHGYLRKIDGGKEIDGSLRKDVWLVVHPAAKSAKTASSFSRFSNISEAST